MFDRSQRTLICFPPGRRGSYTIPGSVTNIGDRAFYNCELFSSVVIGSGVTSIGDEAFFDCISLTNVAMGNSVTTIGDAAFYDCGLTSLTIPDSVTSIGSSTFHGCGGLKGIYFFGNAPSLGETVFNTRTTVYYLPGTTGWGATYGGLPTAPWVLPNPVILTMPSGFGVGTNGFGFIISWAKKASVVVEATANLANPSWIPLTTNTLISGSAYFSDPQWTNYPSRFYRLRWP